MLLIEIDDSTISTTLTVNVVVLPPYVTVMVLAPEEDNVVGEQLKPLEIVFELPSLYFAVSDKPEAFNVSPTKYFVMLGFVFIDSSVTTISVQ